jgi:hypothetical protein
MVLESKAKIDFLFWEECPSYPDAWDRLQRILQEKGLNIKINRVRIRSDEEAKEWGFVGSPTILINGADIDLQGASNQPIGLNCRIYHTPEGRVTPLPPESLIRQAIENSLKK